ncbi:PREDICTED: uncharacterized protein LOC104604690 isoform X2 [Nelumbo nucifera]|uniref:Protein TILLER ANGLE CONTROL 1 n=2 Tax=Nelumbo nucifera TaxID=4432 RepID=A0A1U8AIF0_NELNU|nr:PREDICTED: uncharacterized protein LOC104604690 isoform X2 [Nelumbo nucifera]DAD18006.1 TPA_asm: hypothetical protein HUJ06_019469 [Nelumbo nucifera]
MKIFNWVHRKFHHNVDFYTVPHKKDAFGDFGHNTKKTEVVTYENDTEALLEHVNLVDVLEGWKDGLLSIGTLGFDPLKRSNQPNEYSVDHIQVEYSMMEEEEEDADEEEDAENEGELNPLVVKAFKREFEKVLGSYTDSNSQKSDVLRADIDDTPLIRFLESPEIRNACDNSESDKKKRTTLADLFSADREVPRKLDSTEVPPDSGKKTLECRTKHGVSLAKKLLPRKGEDSRPITKLQRLMKRMLKRKIHPELGDKIDGVNGPIDASKTEIGNNVVNHSWGGGDAAIEMVSLLQAAGTRL